VAIIEVAYSFFTPKERRLTLQIRVSIGIPNRRLTGPIVLLK
jgi:hypothetical protein